MRVFPVILLAAGLTACWTGTGQKKQKPLDLDKVSPVVVDVLSLGFDGYVHDGPTVLRYRLTNTQPARKISLEIVEVPPEDTPLFQEFMEINGVISRRIDLDPGEVHEGRWILPGFRTSYIPDARFYLVARDGSDRVVGKGRIPDPELQNPIIILASSDEQARRIRDSVESEFKNTAYSNPDVLMYFGRLPRIWYEWQMTRAVILARPWSGLGGPAQQSLARWASLGGRLIMVPDACPDWADGPWKDVGPFGTGRIHVAPEEGLDGWLYSNALLDWQPYPHGLDTWWQAPPASQGYVMPSTLGLVLFILLIIVLVGPVTHLTLAAIKRREWAWVAVPGISVVLAVGMYGLASGIKGEGTVLEQHRVIRSVNDCPEAWISTMYRVMSPKKQNVSLSVGGVHPWARPPYGRYGQNAVDTIIRPGSVRFARLMMQRWSVQDFRVFSFARSLPPALTVEGDDVTITNPGNTPLTDLFFWNGAGWIAVKQSLKPGGKTTTSLTAESHSSHEIEPGWEMEVEKDHLGMWLDGMTTSWSSAGYNSTSYVLVARCDRPEAFDTSMTPVPDKVYETTTCVWEVSE
jgi:hypothetical protein